MPPQDRPQNPNGTTETALWAEDDLNVVKPDTAKQNLGYEQNEDPSSSFRNWLDRAVTRLTRFVHFRFVRGDTGMIASWIQTAGVYGTSADLQAALPYSEVYLEGVLVEIQAVASHTFTASKDTYVGVDVDANLEYNETTNGGAEPTPTAGYTHICKVITDTNNVTSAVATLSTVPRLGDVKGRTIDVQPDSDGDAIIGRGGGASGVGVTGNGAGGKAGVLANSGTTGPASRHVGTAAGQPAVQAVHTNSGPGATFAGNGTGAGLEATGGATGRGVRGIGGGTSGEGVKGESSTVSAAILGESTNTAGTGIQGTTPAAATVNAIAVKATTGTGDATALKADSSAGDGYAAILQADATSPARAPLRMVPQDTDPSSSADGDITVHSGFDQVRAKLNALWHGLWSTPGGFCTGFTYTSTLQTHGNDTYTTKGSVVLATPYHPKVVGKVRIRISFEASTAAAGSTFAWKVLDSTHGTNEPIAEQIEVMRVGSTAADERYIVREVEYTLPAAGARTFAFQMRNVGAASTSYARRVALRVDGVFA